MKMTRLFRPNRSTYLKPFKGRRPLSQRIADLRQFLSFLERNTTSAEAEYRLQEQRRARFIYLIDFQEIFDRIAPYMEHPLKLTPILSHHFTSRRFFDELEEQISLPLGTLAELSNFLRHVRRNVRFLTEAALTRNLDRAIDSFVRYFRTEGFLEQGSVLDWVRGDGQSPTSTDPYGPQKKAVLILASYERGLSTLDSILSNSLNYDLRSLPVDLPAPSFRDKYREVFGTLTGEGPTTRRRLGNQADAFNLSLITILNAQLAASARADSPQNCLKLVTDTNTLLHLPERSSISLDLTLKNFRNTGHDIDLLEPYEVVILKRLTRRYINEHGTKRFDEFTDITRKARQSLRSLEDTFFLPDDEIDLLQYFNTVLLPAKVKDRDRLRKIHRYVEDLNDFFLKERELTSDMRLREERQQLILRPWDASPVTFAAESVASIERLLRSISVVIEANDPIGSELTPFQAGDEKQDWWNPVLSLERLGYQVIKGSEDYGKQGIILDILRSDDLQVSVLRIERRGDLFIATWPTTLPLKECVGVIMQKDIFQLASPSEVAAQISSNPAGDSSVWCEMDLLEEKIRDIDNPTFIRIETESFAFILELFSSEPQFWVRSGIMMKDLDSELTKRLFLALSSEDCNTLFSALVSNEVDSLKGYGV